MRRLPVYLVSCKVLLGLTIHAHEQDVSNKSGFADMVEGIIAGESLNDNLHLFDGSRGRDSRMLLHKEFPNSRDIVDQLKRFDESNDKEVFHEFSRVTNSSKPIEYDDHPFEILRERHLKESRGYKFTDEENSEHDDFIHRHLSPWDRNSVYRPMRIHLDTKFLALVTDDYGPEVAFLKNELLPRAQKLWQAALRTYPVSNNVVITSNDCPISSKYQNHTGVPNTDLVIFVAANLKDICNSATEPLVAATSCQYDQYDRPVVGRATVCLQDLDITDSYSTVALFKLIVHGFAHILGFSHRDYQYYHNPATGMPRTPRPFQKRTVTCVDGGQQLTVLPTGTIQPGFTKRGLRYFEVTTPTVRMLARNQFDCQVMTGARLENQPTNNGNCFGSHWEARLFAFDIVTAIALPTNQVLSEMTLGLFEDSGWYKADYGIAKTSPFGHGRGCDFVYEDCIQNGEVPEWSKGFFCNELLTDKIYMCDPNHAHITYCDLVDYNSISFAVPPNRNQRYFPGQPFYGGLMHTADYCPLTSKIQFDCTIGFGADVERMDVEFFGPNSRCMETTLDRPVCLKFECNVQFRRVVVHFEKYEPIMCENVGDYMDLPGSSGGQFECPDFESICPEMSCPNNCNGRGVCDYTLDAPFCKCCDPTDLSEDCRNSPPGCDMNGKMFFCGFNEDDASNCDQSSQCPGGTDFECPGNQKCFGILECNPNEGSGNKFCGVTQSQASSCLSGSSCDNDSDCPAGSYCHHIDSCTSPTNNKHCGSSPFAASSCNDGTECVTSTDCPSGQECYNVNCNGNNKNSFCGSSLFGASQCTPGNECITDADCPNGQKCEEVTQCSQQPPDDKYCGPSLATAAACFAGSACRNDYDCPSGSSCYNVDCNNSNRFPKHCGPTAQVASSCYDGTECITSSDCPSGQQCFNVQCNNSPNNNQDYTNDKQFCGSSPYGASQCKRGNECITSSDCPSGQQCFDVKCNTLDNANDTKFCGSSPYSASQCKRGNECISDVDCPGGQMCHDVPVCSEPLTPSPTISKPTGFENGYCGLLEEAAKVCSPGTGCRTDLDCPDGLMCFDVEVCSQPGTKHCGLSEFGASSCSDGTECVTSIDCPTGQQCYDVDCQGHGNHFCGYSSYSSSKCLAGSECVTDTDCPDSQTCRYVNQCITPPTIAPTAMPTPKPRAALRVKYLLCLEHGLLTSTFKLTKNTAKEIRRILTEKFADKIVDIDEKWGVDETHLRVEDVSSEYLKDAPGNFECTCEVGDSKSVCSAVDSSVEISFWKELDRDIVRFVLLLFQEYVVADFRYPAKYWGFTPFETIAEIKLKGITPGEILEETWAKRFAAKLKEGMNLDSKNIKIPGYQVLVARVDSAVVSNRSLRSLQSRLKRGLFADSSTVTMTVAGQYKAPPQFNDFREVVDGSVDRLVAPERVDSTFDGALGTGVEVETDADDTTGGNGSSSGNDAGTTEGNGSSFSKDKVGDKYSDDFANDFGVPKKENTSNIGTIFGILFSIIALLMFLTLVILFINRRKKENIMYMKERELNTYDPNQQYEGDFYGHYAGDEPISNHDMNSHSYRGDSRYDEASEYDESTYDADTYNDSFRDTIKTSVITDPTYRGGKFPNSHRYNEVNSYEDGYGGTYADSRTYDEGPIQEEAEDEFDDNDVGTYTGLMLKSNEADEVSCLMSVRGVEDAWINTSNRQMRAQSIPKPENRDMMTSVDVSNHTQQTLQESVISAPTMISAPTVLIDRPGQQQRFRMTRTSSQRSSQTGVGSRLSQDNSTSKSYTSAPTVIIDSAKNDDYEELLNFTNDREVKDDDDQSKLFENERDYTYSRGKSTSNARADLDDSSEHEGSVMVGQDMTVSGSIASDDTAQTKNIKHRHVRAQPKSNPFTSTFDENVRNDQKDLYDKSRMITNRVEKQNPFDTDLVQSHQLKMTQPTRAISQDSRSAILSIEAGKRQINESMMLTNGSIANHKLLPMIDEGEDSEQEKDATDFPLLPESESRLTSQQQIVSKTSNATTNADNEHQPQASNMIEYGQETPSSSSNNEVVLLGADRRSTSQNARALLGAGDNASSAHDQETPSSSSNNEVVLLGADRRSTSQNARALLGAGDESSAHDQETPSSSSNNEVVLLGADRRSTSQNARALLGAGDESSSAHDQETPSSSSNNEVVLLGADRRSTSQNARALLGAGDESSSPQQHIVTKTQEMVTETHHHHGGGSNKLVIKETREVVVVGASGNGPSQKQIVTKTHEIVTKTHHDSQPSQESNTIEYNQDTDGLHHNNEVIPFKSDPENATTRKSDVLLEAGDDVSSSQHHIVSKNAHWLGPKTHSERRRSNKLVIEEARGANQLEDDQNCVTTQQQQQLVPKTQVKASNTDHDIQSKERNFIDHSRETDQFESSMMVSTVTHRTSSGNPRVLPISDNNKSSQQQLVSKSHRDNQSEGSIMVAYDQNTSESYSDDKNKIVCGSDQEHQVKVARKGKEKSHQASNMILSSQGAKSVIQGQNKSGYLVQRNGGQDRRKVSSSEMIESKNNAKISVSGIGKTNIPGMRSPNGLVPDKDFRDHHLVRTNDTMMVQSERKALPNTAVQRENSIGKMGFVIDTSEDILTEKASSSEAKPPPSQFVPRQTNHTAKAKSRMSFVDRAKLMQKNAIVPSGSAQRASYNYDDDQTCDGRTVLTID